MLASIRTFVVLCGLAALAVPARADVLVVDGGPGPNHFATIQAAIDAAAIGDTVLVSAKYNTATQDLIIDGKGVNVFIDTPATQHDVRRIVIRNVPASQRASVSGFRMTNAPGIALELLDNAGEVRLYNVGGVGKKGNGQTATQIARPGFTGGIITNCADVVMRRGGTAGGDGGEAFVPAVLATSDGGTGLIVTNSKLSAFYTTFTGGEGGHVLNLGSTLAGGAGGTAW